MPDKPNFLNEKAEYNGKKVDLNNPFRAPKGSPKKFYVYVRNEKGNVIRLGFGDPNMEIKRDDPERIKNFRARHNCSDPGPKYKARYWSCKFWEKGKKVSDLTKQGKVESTECDCGCDCCNEQLDEYRGNPYTTERGGKRGPRMSRQRKNRAAVLDHLILNGIQVLNQPSDVTQKGSSDTFVVAKKDLKRAIEVVDDYFSKPYVRIHMGKNQLRRDNYTIVSEMSESDLKYKGKEMKDHLDKAKAKLIDKYGSLDNVDYKKAMKVVGATLAARLASRGMIKRSDGEKKKGELGISEDKRIPKTRDNQDPDTHSDLYTDEDPRGTIHGLGFKDVETSRASVKKIESSDRTHAHKIQAAIAMEQRAKVMGKTAEAKVYRDYIEKMKKKTKEMQGESLWDNIRKKRERIKRGSGERMRKKGEKGAPTQDQIDRAKSEDKKYYTKSGKIKKSPEDKASGLPKKYVSGLSDKEAKQKAKEIKRRMSLPKDHPDAYKPVDDVEDPSISTTKKKQSKYTLKYKKMFGEETELHEASDTIKGWIHPRKKKVIKTERSVPYHVQFIVGKPKEFGLTEKQIEEYLVKKYNNKGLPNPEEDARDAMEQLQFGQRDIEHGIERMAMKKGWVRFVSGSYGEICSLDKLNDRQLGVVLNIMEDEGIIGDASGFYTKEMTLEYYMARDEERYPEIVNVKYYGTLENSEIKNLIKGKPRGAKQTEIGRTMAMFRGESIEVPHKKRNWTKLPIKQLGKNNDLTQDVFDMIDKSYGPIGGYPDFKKPSDLPSDSTDWIGVDTDKEPDFDAVRFSKPGPGGQKMTGSATDGSEAAKKMMVNKTAKMLDTKGNYAEMSGAIAHIMITRKGVPYVADEESARRLLPGKDIEWVGKHPEGKYPGYEGWYYRILGGKKRIKIILGRPNGAVVQNPT